MFWHLNVMSDVHTVFFVSDSLKAGVGILRAT